MQKVGIVCLAIGVAILLAWIAFLTHVVGAPASLVGKTYLVQLLGFGWAGAILVLGGLLVCLGVSLLTKKRVSGRAVLC